MTESFFHFKCPCYANRMLKIVLVLFALTSAVFAQAPTNYAVYDGKGRPSTIDAVVAALADADVAFLGEMHDDTIGHQVQLEIFKRVIERYGAKRKVTLSLEMFERDVQTIVNEYLAGQITESHFLRSSRPWDNYRPDYRPLVELARERKLEVIAANAPRRYVNMVSRNGIASLNSLSPEAKRWLPPFPIAKPSEAYSAKFKSLLGNSSEARMGIENILLSQSLWDAAMAHAVAQSLKKNPRSLVVHLNGSFHTEKRLGTVEHFLAYRPKAKAVVVTIQPVDDIKKFEYTDAGDFVVLTDKRGVNAAERSKVLERMNKHHKRIQTVKADIERSIHNVQLDEVTRYSGKVVFVSGSQIRKNTLRIDWLKPRAETFSLVNGQWVLYVPSINRAYYGSDSFAEKIPVVGELITMNSATVNNWIDKTAYLGEKRQDDGKVLSGLSFPSLKKEFKAIEIWVDQDGRISSGKIIGNNGDTDEFVFRNMKFNQTVSIGSFRVDIGKAERIKAN